MKKRASKLITINEILNSKQKQLTIIRLILHIHMQGKKANRFSYIMRGENCIGNSEKKRDKGVSNAEEP